MDFDSWGHFDLVKPYIRPQWRKPIGLIVGLVGIFSALATVIKTIEYWPALISLKLSPLSWSILINCLLLLAVGIFGLFLWRSRRREAKKDNSLSRYPEEKVWATKEFFEYANVKWSGTLRFFNKGIKVQQSVDGPFCPKCEIRLTLINQFLVTCPKSCYVGARPFVNTQSIHDITSGALATLELMWRKEPEKFYVVYESWGAPTHKSPKEEK